MSDKKTIYFIPGDEKGSLCILFYSAESIKGLHSSLEAMLRMDFPEEPECGLYLSQTGTFKDHHP